MPHGMQTELEVELLGCPRAWLGSAELQLGPARQRAVFVILAAHREREVSLTELVDGVWGTSAPASAPGSVHTYVSGLRGALRRSGITVAPNQVLRSNRSSYSLRLGPGASDVCRFERDVAAASRLTVRGQTREAARLLDQALTCWRGEAYSGVPGPFAERERDRLAELRMSAVEQRATLLLDLGEPGELVAELSELVRQHPLRETLYVALMRALHATGRTAEALSCYHDARLVLQEELGIRPGPALRAMQESILSNAPISSTQPRQAVPASLPREFVGRRAEAKLLDGLVAGVAAGRGQVVWVEGEAGIGKSRLLEVGLARAAERGCQVAWAVANELKQRFTLQVMTECLDVRQDSADPSRAELADELHGTTAWQTDDPVPAAVDGLLGIVDEMCATAPLVLVIDDLQWADRASVLLWQRLAVAARQLPLLLVAGCRTPELSGDLATLKRGVRTRAGVVLELERLGDDDTYELFRQNLGARPGDSLRSIVNQASGNPLYAVALANDLVHRDALRIENGVAEADEQVPLSIAPSLLAAVDRSLDTLSAETLDVLRTAALLGSEFTVAELGAVTARTPVELIWHLEEATRAGLLVDGRKNLAFRHPFQRRALYERIPGEHLAELHRYAARALDAHGGTTTRVAEQLAAAQVEPDSWITAWLVRHHAEVSGRAPQAAADLLRRVLEGDLPAGPQRAELAAALVRVLFRLEETPEREAEQAMLVVTDPAARAEMRQLLAALRYRRGAAADAIELLIGALTDPRVPEIWQTRHRTLLANFRRGDLSDLDETVRTAHRLRIEAEARGDRYPAAHAAQTLWLVHSIRREHDHALAAVESALNVVGDDPALAGTRFDLLDNRLFTLQNLDRLTEAEQTLREGHRVAAQHGLATGLQVSAAVHHYWTGQWDEALAELDSVTDDGPAITFCGAREPGAAALLLHGVAALIAGRRDDQLDVRRHLDAAQAHAPANSAERESCDFHLAALALAAEQRGRLTEALRLFEPVLRRDFAPMMLRHQWLPDVVRMALTAHRQDIAEAAAEVCSAEESLESGGGRAEAAALRCRALLGNDPAPALTAAAHYREVGRPVEQADTLQDTAELLARTGRLDEAAEVLNKSNDLFASMSAWWSIRRGDARLRQYGVMSATVPRTVLASLSDLELRVAELVAANQSNPQIAAALGLPRRTVQSHVSRVLTKLRTHSRSHIGRNLLHAIG